MSVHKPNSHKIMAYKFEAENNERKATLALDKRGPHQSGSINTSTCWCLLRIVFILYLEAYILRILLICRLDVELKCLIYSVRLIRRPTLDIQDVAKDDQHDMAPPRFIEVQKGKISLGPVPIAKPAFEATKDKVSWPHRNGWYCVYRWVAAAKKGRNKLIFNWT